MLEKLTEELLTALNNGDNPYKTCKKYLNMSMDIGTQSVKMEQINQSKAKKVVQMTMLGAEVAIYNSVRSAQHQTDIQNISKACHGEYLSAGGYKWKYKET